MLSAYQVHIVVEFVAVTPAEVRGQAIGPASAGLLAGQGGAGLLAGGVLGASVGTAPAIAIAGVTGAVLAVPMALNRRRGNLQDWPHSEPSGPFLVERHVFTLLAVVVRLDPIGVKPIPDFARNPPASVSLWMLAS